MKTVSFTVDMDTDTDEDAAQAVIDLMQRPLQCDLVFMVHEAEDEMGQQERAVRIRK